MPWKSRAQAAYMHIHHPEIAGEFDAATRALKRKKPLPYKVGKSDASRDRRKGAAAGVGGVGVVGGLVGGGLPGVEPKNNLNELRNSSRFRKVRPALEVSGGGIFGYRQQAHKRFIADELAANAAHGHGVLDRGGTFARAVGRGKIPQERQVLRHLKVGRRMSHGALVGGGALLAYGASRDKPAKVRKASDDERRRRNASITAGGATVAGGSYGVARGLERQGKYWARRSAASLDEAGRIVPKAGGYEYARSATKVPNVRPHMSLDDIQAKHKEVLAGKSRKQVEQFGRLRGAAAQQRHFARDYGFVARGFRRYVMPAGAAVAAAGGIGMAADKYRDRKGVSKMLGSEVGHGTRMELVPVAKAGPDGYGRKQQRHDMAGGVGEATVGGALGAMAMNHKPIINRAQQANEALYQRRLRPLEGAHGLDTRGRPTERPVPRHIPNDLRGPARDVQIEAKRAEKLDAKLNARRLAGKKLAMRTTRNKVAHHLNRGGRQTLIASGLVSSIPLVWHGAHRTAAAMDRPVTKAETKRTSDVNRGMAGALAGGLTYQGAGFAMKPTYEKKLRHQIASRSDPDQAARYRKIEVAHTKEMGLTGKETLGDPKYLKFYRNYPKELPGARYRRALSYTHGGKTQVGLTALTAGVTGAAAIAAGRARDKRRTPLREVGKALGDYQFLLPNIRQEIQYGIPETRQNPISPMAMVAGANLAAAGWNDLQKKGFLGLGKKKRRERGMLKLSIANQLSGQPTGIGVGL